MASPLGPHQMNTTGQVTQHDEDGGNVENRHSKRNSLDNFYHHVRDLQRQLQHQLQNAEACESQLQDDCRKLNELRETSLKLNEEVFKKRLEAQQQAEQHLVAQQREANEMRQHLEAQQKEAVKMSEVNKRLMTKNGLLVVEFKRKEHLVAKINRLTVKVKEWEKRSYSLLEQLMETNNECQKVKGQNHQLKEENRQLVCEVKDLKYVDGPMNRSKEWGFQEEFKYKNYLSATDFHNFFGVSGPFWLSGGARALHAKCGAKWRNFNNNSADQAFRSYITIMLEIDRLVTEEGMGLAEALSYMDSKMLAQQTESWTVRAKSTAADIDLEKKKKKQAPLLQKIDPPQKSKNMHP